MALQLQTASVTVLPVAVVGSGIMCSTTPLWGWPVPQPAQIAAMYLAAHALAVRSVARAEFRRRVAESN